MKQLLLIAAMFAHFGGSMKLVDKNTEKVVVEFKDEAVTFYSRFLEAQFEEQGILIPPAMQSQFEGKGEIFLEDPLFKKAFVEVYLPFYMAGASSPYEWRE